MQNQNFHANLQRVFQQFDVEQAGDKSLLLHAFEAGQKAAFEESNQQATLLKPAPAQTEWKLPELKVEEWPEFTFEGFIEGTSAVELTPRQADFLKVILRNLANIMQDYRKVLKGEESTLYLYCDEETEMGKMAFKQMNAVRNELRRNKELEAKVNDLIRTVKYGG